MKPAPSTDLALDYIERHPDHFIFPIKAGAKTPPLIQNNLEDASNDPEQINFWRKKHPRCNWGLALAKSGLIVVDIDMKKGKVGKNTFAILDVEHGWPKTLTVATPSKGAHLYYRGKHVFALGKHGFGPDIDSPNYVLIPGCVLADGTSYSVKVEGNIAAAPEWFSQYLKPKPKPVAADAEAAVNFDKPENIAWAKDYLLHDAPFAIEGQGGELTTFKVAAALRDHGISRETAKNLMAEIYNQFPTCDPLWEIADLEKKIDNAFDYASINAPGEGTAESDFANEPPEPMPPLTPLAAQQKVERDTLTNRPPEEQAIIATRAGLCEDWVYIMGGKLFVCREPDPELGYLMWDKTAFDDAFAYAAPPKVKLSKAMFVLKTKTIRKLNSMCYRPGHPEFYGKQFNLYKPPALKPAPGDTSLWDAHLVYLFPDKADRDLVLNWIAWLLQNLTLKPKHALLIQGIIQGTGKSFIAEVLERILGSHNVSPISQSDLHGTFNRWAEHAKLLLIEELRALDKAEVKNKLHPLITQQRITINDKGEKTFPMINCFGVMAMTNDPVAVPLEDSDRRYAVVQTKAIPRDVKEFDGVVNEDYDPDYYKRLYNLLEQPEAMAAIAYQLQHRPLGKYDARSRAPFTAAKAEMMAEAAPEIEKWMLDHADLPPLSYSLVELGEVAEMIPKRLQQRGMDGIVRRVLRQRFKGIPVGQVRVGADRSRLGPKTSLWALGPNGAALLKTRHSKLADLYASERGQVHARIEAEAEAQFADDDPAA